MFKSNGSTITKLDNNRTITMKLKVSRSGSFCFWLAMVAMVGAADLTNYSLSFSTNQNGTVTLDTWPSSQVTHESEFTAEAWVKLEQAEKQGVT